MNLKSIRWRLPLSYIAIALVAALASGALMLAVLRSYYQQAERNYLVRNVASIALAAQQLFQAGVTDPVLADQVMSWSFLLQARVQVYDQDGNLLVDSGTPKTQQVMMVAGAAGGGAKFEVFIPAGATPVTNTLDGPGLSVSSGIFLLPGLDQAAANQMIVINDCSPGLPCTTQSFNNAGSGEVISGTASSVQPVGVVMPLAGSIYGFEMAIEPETSAARRSSQQVEQVLQDADGKELRRVVVSEGPAYGAEILASVARAWGLASLIALVMAGGVGWLVSRRITRPVLHLTGVTAQMAQGDLSARSGADSQDEFGMLGRSFDQMAGQIENLVGALRRFIADAAHELNTPITALQTDMELARTTTDPDERQRLLERLSGQVNRLHMLVRSLLDLSRLEAKAGQRSFEAVDLNDLVETVSEVYASRAEQAAIAFVLDLPAETVTISGDPNQLRAALENLLDNALKFTPEDGRVCLRLVEQKQDVLLIVEDSGIGIPEEDLPLLFRRFHRGRNAAAYPGNGLGLAIVEQIARLHNGSVSAENLPSGVRFTLRLHN
jgi:signal transduction histidine kinase